MCREKTKMASFCFECTTVAGVFKEHSLIVFSGNTNCFVVLFAEE